MSENQLTTIRHLLDLPEFKLDPEASEDLLTKTYGFQPLLELSKSERMFSSGAGEVKPIGIFREDSRRYWLLAIVSIDGLPVMLTQTAGREGDDFSHRFIFDVVGYLNKIRELTGERHKGIWESSATTIVGLDTRLPYTTFYGRTLTLENNNE